MSDVTSLGGPFAIAGAVSLAQGAGGLTKVVLRAGQSSAGRGAVAEVYLNGATVTRYDVGKRAVLFCGRTSKFAPGKAIRGGVPVIFPWFGPHPTDASRPQHGLVRAAAWTVDATHQYADGAAAVVLALESSQETRAVWPYDFALRYTVTLGRRLDMALEVINRSSTEFRFDEALHTYLAVSDVRRIAIHGLEQTEYYDKVEGMARKRHGNAPVELEGETDRVFVNTTAPCRLTDPVNGEVIVRKEGSLSTVVWNPWETKAEALPDLAGGQWPEMVCIETANALENAVVLAPGASHTMRAVIEPVA
jgi:glucose-6-phosphate 1-epimerase